MIDLTANGKTALLMVILSVFMPFLAGIILISFIDSFFVFLFVHIAGIVVVPPGLIALFFFMFGVKSGEKRILRQESQKPFWIAIAALIAVSIVAALVHFLVFHESKQPDIILSLVFIFSIAGLGYPEGRLCAMRKKAKWISILPTTIIFLFLTSLVFISLIHTPFD